MQKISIGQLRVLTYSHIYVFPAPSTTENSKPDLKAELRVVNDVFWFRLCTMGDLGFSEAYMYGDVECDDLVSIFKVCFPVSVLVFVDQYEHRCSWKTDKICQIWILAFRFSLRSHKN